MVGNVTYQIQISSLDKDRNPIGGHPNSFTISSAEEFAANQGELGDEWN
jgi:hypothetical protein